MVDLKSFSLIKMRIGLLTSFYVALLTCHLDRQLRVYRLGIETLQDEGVNRESHQ